MSALGHLSVVILVPAAIVDPTQLYPIMSLSGGVGPGDYIPFYHPAVVPSHSIP